MIALALITIAFGGLIAYLSLVAGDHRALSWMPRWLQRLGHLGCYAVLAFLLSVTLVFFVRNSLARGLVSFALATAFGSLMEYLQLKRPGRSGSFVDAAINAAGALLGVLAAMASY